MPSAIPFKHLHIAFSENPAVRNSLSGVLQQGDLLWLVGDEGSAISSVCRKQDSQDYDGQALYSLKELFLALPGKDEKNGKDKKEEADLEAVALVGDRLWMVGSHSLRRDQPKADTFKWDSDFDLKSRQRQRFLLGYVKLKEEGKGRPVPQKGSGRCLSFTEKGNELTDYLIEDKILAPFLGIPSKDNGFDIEGLAVRARANSDNIHDVYLGLRGPVLRGWALILQLAWTETVQRGKLDKAQPYLCHVLELGGLGVRDLMADGDDLWILAGPTMAMDGPARVCRWRGGLKKTGAQIVRAGDLDWRLDLPVGQGADHPEGMCLYRGPESSLPSLLVVYDMPAASRLDGEDGYKADLFLL